LQDQVDRAKRWLQLCGTAKTVDRKQSGYGIKHEPERWWRANGADQGGCISNGALLIAALRRSRIADGRSISVS
jgi:hypothetical protein